MVPALSLGPDVWWQWWGLGSAELSRQEVQEVGLSEALSGGVGKHSRIANGVLPSSGAGRKRKEHRQVRPVTRTPPKLARAVFSATERAVF